MSFWSRLFQREQPPEVKASAAGAAISAWTINRPVWTTRDYAGFAYEGYQLNAIVNRCVTMIAGQAAAVPWLLYSGGDKNNEIVEHPLLNLLQVPSPIVGGAALFQSFYSYLLLSGNGYLEIVGTGPNDMQPPRELWTLRPDRMRVISGSYGMPAGYEYEAYGIKKQWGASPVTGKSRILHVKDFNPLDDWYGQSRLEAGAFGVDRHNAASSHNKALLDNGCRPSGALIFEPVKNGDTIQTAPLEAIKAAEEELLDRHNGVVKAGKPMVLGGNVKWQEMGLNPKDMDFNDGKDDSARDICAAFGVPHILVVPGENTYNNIREAKLQLWEETILPLMDRVVDALNMWLVPRFGNDLTLSYDLDEISALEPRREGKRTSILELVNRGVIDPDEARAALQYAPRGKDAVLKIDHAVVTALVGSANTVGITPLLRYMQSVGLVDASATEEQVLAAARKIPSPEPATDPATPQKDVTNA